jgi:hypothetical protein
VGFVEVLIVDLVNAGVFLCSFLPIIIRMVMGVLCLIMLGMGVGRVVFAFRGLDGWVV